MDPAQEGRSTKVLLITGELLEVEGPINDVERLVEDAARSTTGTLAWLKDARTEEPVGVNPMHDVTLRPGDE